MNQCILCLSITGLPVSMQKLMYKGNGDQEKVS